ncbi:MAG: DUF4430 domain-containing protein [Lachnospiraceae bacterium]|nr:DUF4430 domain-containing protein [Lachnospiraceae bacterium]
MKKNIKRIIIILVIVIIVGAAAFILLGKDKDGKKIVNIGKKNITIEVTNSKKEKKQYLVQTTGTTIKDALDNTEGLTIKYIETEDGASIIGVNGEVLDNQYKFWSFQLNGEFCENPVDRQEIQDGDKITIYFTMM